MALLALDSANSSVALTQQKLWRMKKFLSLLAIPVALQVCSIAHSAQFTFPTQTLTVPDGFEVELVAGPPLVDRPIEADFDEHGRLYVTESSGSNDKSDKQLQAKPH